MQLSLRPAQAHLFHSDAVNAIAAWRGTAGHAPLRLLRNDRVGPGRRPRRLLAACALALGILGSAGFAAVLLPADAPSDPGRRTIAERGVSDADLARALQAAGAFSGPLPGRDRPALRFGASPELPFPEMPSPEPSLAVLPPEIAPVAEAAEGERGPAASAAVAARPASPGTAEPAAETRAEPVHTAALSRPPVIAPAPPRAATYPRATAAPAAKPHRVALAARKAESTASPPPAGPAPSWTLPVALAPTAP